MTAHWQVPVRTPLLTSILVDEWAVGDENERPKAFDTPLRFSDAGACSRRLGFEAAGVPRSDPMDLAGSWVTGVGEILHGIAQEAIGRRFPEASFEVKGQLGEIASGHADALVPDLGDLGDTVYELKHVGGFAFTKAIGLNKNRRTLVDGQGPRLSAVLQGGLNALAQYADTVIVGDMAMESVSVQLGEAVGLSGRDRFMAEFHIERDVWQPMAEIELARMESIVEVVDAGLLPDGWVQDDDGTGHAITPFANKPAWNCEYCAFRSVCETYSRGVIELRTEHKVATDAV